MNTRHLIRAILFDYGGVIADPGFRNGLVALARQQGLDAGRLVHEGVQALYDSGYITGRGTAAEFWQSLRRRSGLSGDDGTLTETIVSGFAPRPRMLELVRRLRSAGYLAAILSDQTDWLDELDARHHFKGEFDRVFNSFRLGKDKRDCSLFADVAADIGLPPTALLFIDDDPGNVERARASGYQAMLFSDQDSSIAHLERLLFRASEADR